MKKVIFLLLLFLGMVVNVQADTTYMLNRADLQVFYGGFQLALENSPTHRSTTWENPATGLHGSTVPIRDMRLASGEFCREFMANVEIGHFSQQTYGLACRLPDGRWNITREQAVEKFATISGSAPPADLGHSSCPGQVTGRELTSPNGQMVHRFSDPYLARIHQFLGGKASGGTYHNWRELFEWVHGRKAPQSAQPPVETEPIKRSKPSELIKLVGN